MFEEWKIEPVVVDLRQVLRDQRLDFLVRLAAGRALEIRELDDLELRLRIAAAHRGLGITHVAGIEARGFIFGAGVAIALGVGFVPVRKKGKLPGETIGQNYALEYGVDTIEIHADVIDARHKVLMVDDLIATGGTAVAAVSLLRRTGAVVSHAGFVIDLLELGGAEKLRAMDVAVFKLIDFAGH